jgi:AraC-like DNA-binding protein
MHRHESVAECILIRKGHGIHHIDGRKYDTRPGDLLLIDSGIVHDEAAAGEGLLYFYSCALTDVHLAGLPENHFLQSGQCPVLKTGEMYDSVASLFAQMYTCSTRPPYGAEELMSHLVQALLIEIAGLTRLAGPAARGKENELAEQVKAYADAHYMQNLTLVHMAKHFSVSTYYISHIYKKYYGYSFMQYVTRRRIGEAQTLLIDTNLPITDIALRVGYGTSSYFHDIFCKVTGISPRNYRNLYKYI